MLKLLKKILSYEIISEKNEKKESELAISIFERAMQENATAVLFGVPPGENFNREDHRIFNREVDEETRNFAKLQGLEVKEPETIEISNIPIFMMIKNKWYYVFDLPMSLHTYVIESIKDYACEFELAALKVNFPIESANASFTFDTNENHNYLASDLKFHPK